MTNEQKAILSIALTRLEDAEDLVHQAIDPRRRWAYCERIQSLIEDLTKEANDSKSE